MTQTLARSKEREAVKRFVACYCSGRLYEMYQTLSPKLIQ